MLRPIESQAILRTVFGLWRHHHQRLKELFRLNIRARAFFKSHLASKVLSLWTRAINSRKKLHFQLLKLSSNHRRHLKDKTLAGLLLNIMQRKARRRKVVLGNRVYNLGLARRTITLLRTNVNYSLNKVQMHRNALIIWRTVRYKRTFTAWKKGLQINKTNHELRKLAQNHRKNANFLKTFQRLQNWASGKQLREKLRLESIFFWKRKTLKNSFKYLLNRYKTGKILKKRSENANKLKGKWRKIEVFRTFSGFLQRRKWLKELISHADYAKLVAFPSKKALISLKSHVQNNQIYREKIQKAEKLHKKQLLNGLKVAIRAQITSKLQEISAWNRKNRQKSLFQAWVSLHFLSISNRNRVKTAIFHRLNFLFSSWKLAIRQKTDKTDFLSRITRQIRQKHKKRLLRYWLVRKRHKEELRWKTTMAGNQNKLRLFRIMMNACALSLHYRKTKQYAEETYRNKIIGRVFAAWSVTIRRKIRKNIFNFDIKMRKYEKIFEAWKSISQKSQNLDKLEILGRKIRLKWAKMRVLQGLKLYLQLNMGQIAKKRLLARRRNELKAKFTLEKWKKGIEMYRKDRKIGKIIKNERGKRVIKKVLKEWIGKLQQKNAIKVLKRRKMLEILEEVQHFRKHLYYQKWRNYHEKRQNIQEKYRFSFKLYRKISLQRFYQKFRVFHREFGVNQRKIELGNSHYSVKILKKSLRSLGKNVEMKGREREKLGVALHYWAQLRYRRGVEGLVRNKATRKWKRKMMEVALDMRRGDLISAALQKLHKVGGEWKQERLKIASKARLQKEQRVWKLVSKFAQRWKEKTIQRRKLRAINALYQQKTPQIPSKTQTIPRVRLEEKTEMRVRPQPRRPNFSGSGAVTVSAKVPVTPVSLVPSVQRPLSPRSRLESIQTELLSFKFEKEKIAEYEVYVSANPGNSVLEAQLRKMKERLDGKKGRVKELLQEAGVLKAGE